MTIKEEIRGRKLAKKKAEHHERTRASRFAALVDAPLVHLSAMPTVAGLPVTAFQPKLWRP